MPESFYLSACEQMNEQQHNFFQQPSMRRKQELWYSSGGVKHRTMSKPALEFLTFKHPS